MTPEEKKARHRAYCKKWREANPDRVKEIHALYRERNLESIRSRHKGWVEENPETNASHKRKHYENNKDRYNARAKEYWASRPDEKAAHCAKRRTKKKMAIPSWANHGYLNLFYKLAGMETKRTGRKVEVDHIVPLQSEYVCGLHCEDNLQLLFSSDNYIKGNRHWVGM